MFTKKFMTSATSFSGFITD